MLNRADALIDAAATGMQPRAGTPVLRLDVEVARATERWLNEHIRWASQKLAVIADAAPGTLDRVMLRAIEEHYQRIAIGQHTVTERGTVWARNFLLTLARRQPWASQWGEPFEGRPVFIVAAGPSLDKNGHLLREAQLHGPVVAVNTSVTACMHYGVVPDLVLCCEAKDLRTHLEPLLGFARVPVALDSFASEHNWNACERPCGFIRHEPSLIPYALQLGTLPVNYDGSVACAAVSLSILLGAEQVVLVGQDLAYTGGKCYADGTPFADLRASVIGDMLCVSGESKQVGPAPVVWRNGWREGEPVPSTRGMDDFVAWFAKAAKLYPVVNATEGGAHIPNTHEFALEDVLRQTRRRKRVVLPELEVQDSSAVRERMCELATSCLAGDAFTPPEGLSVLQLWCVPAILRAGEQGGSVRQMRAAMREAIEQGCREILEVLG